MTNNNNEENIHWESSTTNRDNLKKNSLLIDASVRILNTAISAYNNSIGFIARLAGAKKIEHVSADEIIELAKSGSGGATFALGVIDSAAKLAGKIPIVGIFAAPIEIACDHLKDLINSMGMAGLSADIGDLKEGQAKLNAKVDAQGKRLSEKMNGIKSELEKNLTEAKKDLEEKIKNADENQKKELKKAKEELQRQIGLSILLVIKVNNQDYQGNY